MTSCYNPQQDYIECIHMNLLKPWLYIMCKVVRTKWLPYICMHVHACAHVHTLHTHRVKMTLCGHKLMKWKCYNKGKKII